MNYKKKILVISQGYWPEHFPINQLADSFHEDKKIEISVLTGFPNYPEGKIYKGYEKNFFNKIYDIHPKGYKIFRVPLIRRRKNSKISVVLNYLSFIVMGTLIAPFLLINNKFDYILVFANSPVPQAIIGIFLKFIKRAKLILWVQDLWPEILNETNNLNNRTFLKVINYSIKWIYFFSDLILAQSKSFKNEIKKKTNTKVVYLPNPSVDMSKKTKQKKLKKSKFFKILYAGNLGEAQNLNNIIVTSKLLVNEKIIFNIIGGGNKYLWLKNKIKDENINNIKLYKNVNFSKIHNYYNAADSLLITLKDNKFLNMTIPSKLQNYLSAKKPIISFCGGETKKIIENAKCGLDLYKKNNEKIFKGIISLSKKKKTILDKMSKNGYKFFLNNFEINKTKNKFYKIFNNE